MQNEAGEYIQREIIDHPEGDSSIASTSDLDGRSSNHWKGLVHLLKKRPQKGFQTFPSLNGIPTLTRRKSKQIREELVPALKSPVLTSSFDTDFGYLKSSWKNFSLEELKYATNNFSTGILLVNIYRKK